MAIFKISNLTAQTNYKLSVLLSNSLGQSDVSEVSFKTNILSPGAIIRVPCLSVPA